MVVTHAINPHLWWKRIGLFAAPKSFLSINLVIFSKSLKSSRLHCATVGYYFELCLDSHIAI